MPGDWVARACEELLKLSVAGGLWGYHRDGNGAIEPSALSALAILAANGNFQIRGAEALIATCGSSLSRLQNREGSLGVTVGIDDVYWPTSYAVLLWSNTTTHRREKRLGIQWLLSHNGRALVRIPEDPVGHDTSIIGWSWLEGTHSWMEPTAFAVVALNRAGQKSSARVKDGLRLLRDRSIPNGGWNYGNNTVFGTIVHPYPRETGIGLLALAVDGNRDAIVDRAIQFLELRVPTLKSPQSLGWGLLALSAWNRRPPQADTWLRDAFYNLPVESYAPMDLSILILAATGQSALALFGLAPTIDDEK